MIKSVRIKTKKYISDNGFTYADFSKLLKCSVSTLSRTLNEEREINLHVAFRLEKHSNGHIMAKDWFKP